MEILYRVLLFSFIGLHAMHDDSPFTRLIAHIQGANLDDASAKVATLLQAKVDERFDSTFDPVLGNREYVLKETTLAMLACHHDASAVLQHLLERGARLNLKERVVECSNKIVPGEYYPWQVTLLLGHYSSLSVMAPHVPLEHKDAVRMQVGQALQASIAQSGELTGREVRDLEMSEQRAQRTQLVLAKVWEQLSN